MQITPHFSVAEFTFSETAARMGITIEPSPEELHELDRLCNLVLEPIRIKLARSMVITSGLRPLRVNTAIGSSDTSAHVFGRAADCNVVGMSAPVFAKWILNNREAERWPIDQCILEFDRWVHLAIAPAEREPRMQFLTAKKINGKTVYLPGIVE